MTLIAFILVMLGCINWFMIGLLQYDFVAGMFGFQGSIFSRIIYIIVGIASIYIIFKTIANKGKINLFEFNFKRKNKDKKANKIKATDNTIKTKQTFDTETAKEFEPKKDEVQQETKKAISNHHSIFDDLNDL